MLDRLIQRTLRNLRRVTLDAILSVGLYSAAALGGMACNDSRNGNGADYSPDASLDAVPAITCVDTDNDRFYATEGCGTPVDCDDYSAETNPAAPEICDYKDNNCNGVIDEDVLLSVYFDNDQDGFGDVQHMQRVCASKLPAGYVSNHDDCDDTNPRVNPVAKELCNLIDDNCNTTIDELCGCATGETKQCGSYGAGECHYGQQTCNDEGVWNPCVDYKNPVPELCNGLDDDCDGFTDDGAQGVWNQDADNDGFGNANRTERSCAKPDGYVDNSTDCDDANASIHPYVPEICNDKDDDCNGFVDEGVTRYFYRDVDDDGLGDWADFLKVCNQPDGYVANSGDCAPDDGARWRYIPGFPDADHDRIGAGERREICSGVTLPVGFVFYDGDCDDNNQRINPYAFDICNNIDDDCDPETPDGVHERAPLNDLVAGVCANTFKECEEGAWQNSYAQIAQYNVQELCDLLDNNCDGRTDEGAQLRFNRDADGDGRGDARTALNACEASRGYVSAEFATDCDDGNPALWRMMWAYRDADGDGAGADGLVEVCAGDVLPAGHSVNNSDCNDRNPAVSELRQAYLDADRDGVGAGELVEVCAGDILPDGYSSNTGDCDDRNARVHPLAEEICDLVDNNCNGETDEGVTQTYYLDEDEDGHGILEQTIEACVLPARLFAAVAGDCDDTRATVNPEAPEVCNSRDDDCNGEADEMGGLCEKILFADDERLQVYVINSDGTNFRSLTEDILVAETPLWRPDGRKISYVSVNENFEGELWTMNPDGSNKQRKAPIENDEYSWVPNGLEVGWFKDQRIHGANIEELYLITVETGEERQVTNHRQEYPEEVGMYCRIPIWNNQGTKAAYTCWKWSVRDQRSREDVIVYDVATQTSMPITEGGDNEDYSRIISWSPDGQRLAYIREEEVREEENAEDIEVDRLYTNNANGGNEQNLPFNGWLNGSPRWSPVEDIIAFTGEIDNQWDVYLVRPEGGEAANLTNHQLGGWARDINWSADGRKIVYVGRLGREAGRSVYVFDKETGVSTDLFQQNRLEFRIEDFEDPVFSPLPPEEE